MTVISQFHKIQQWALVGVAIGSAGLLQAGVSFHTLNATDPTSANSQAIATQGGLLVGETDLGNKVWLDNKKVRVAADGTFILGFGRDASTAELRIELENGEQQIESIKVQARKYNIERVDGLPPAKVNPKGEAVLKRIREEAAQVKDVRTRDDDRQDFEAGFIWPAKGRISGVYGSQRVLNGEPKWPHFGLDIAAPKGSKVVAPAPGIVTWVASDMYYSGGTLIIDHGHGLSSTFLHLSEILVQQGQAVEQGSLVAKIGATGRATGAHLDWRINWFNVRLDPQRLVDDLKVVKEKQ